MVTKCFSRFRGRASYVGTRTDINGSGDGASLSVGILLGNMEGAHLPGTLWEK